MVLVFLSYKRLFRSKHPVMEFLKTLGDYSYSTYLSHIVVIGWFYAMFGNRVGRLKEILVLAGILVSVHCISWLTYKVIETGILPNKLKKVSELLLSK
jgi:peptidoglycan/LPS O-acetylase OafA/YrhL